MESENAIPGTGLVYFLLHEEYGVLIEHQVSLKSIEVKQDFKLNTSIYRDNCYVTRQSRGSRLSIKDFIFIVVTLYYFLHGKNCFTLVVVYVMNHISLRITCGASDECIRKKNKMKIVSLLNWVTVLVHLDRT